MNHDVGTRHGMQRTTTYYHYSQNLFATYRLKKKQEYNVRKKKKIRNTGKKK